MVLCLALGTVPYAPCVTCTVPYAPHNEHHIRCVAARAAIHMRWRARGQWLAQEVEPGCLRLLPLGAVSTRRARPCFQGSSTCFDINDIIPDLWNMLWRTLGMKTTRMESVVRTHAATALQSGAVHVTYAH